MVRAYNAFTMEKIIVITGAGGVLCSEFARALAPGNKIALLDLNLEAASAFEEEINKSGGHDLTRKVLPASTNRF